MNSQIPPKLVPIKIQQVTKLVPTKIQQVTYQYLISSVLKLHVIIHYLKVSIKRELMVVSSSLVGLQMRREPL